MTSKILALAALKALGVVTLMLGCGSMGDPTAVSSGEVGEQRLTLDQLRNASYRGIYDEPVQLTDGKYVGAPSQPGGASRPQVTLVGTLIARGDLDGDGRGEAVVLLAESSGASGTRDYLAVAAERGGKAVNVATELLGDRVQLRAMRIEDGQIVVDTVAHGPGEPMCCPTQKLRFVFKLAGERLLEIRRQPRGTISVADLEGVTWMLEEISFGEPVKPEPSVTLRIEKGQIVGSAGCNSYFAAYSSEGPEEIKIGPAGATRKACAPEIMEQETRYLNALQAVTSYSFLAGDLALTYRQDDSLRTLILAPRTP